jgi:adenine C2-methylase RlmN of 23S rRNA A2503 and tRNA A37
MANLVTFIVMFHNLISTITKRSNIFIYVNIVVGLAYMEEAEKYISKFYNILNKKDCVIFVSIV